jgi:ubiquinone/menaquinone biosynthesis C-methylase UbiE
MRNDYRGGNKIDPDLSNSRSMKPSPASEVRELYESSVESYAQMMDVEIDLPIYQELLSGLHKRLVDIAGVLIDTSCGTGHVLEFFHKKFDAERALLGIDLSPGMVDNATARLGDHASIQVGDMRDLRFQPSMSCSAVLSFYGIHHLGTQELQQALHEWSRVLVPGGQLVVAAWEGSGSVDYGDFSNVIALRYTAEELGAWIANAGLQVDRSWTEDVEGFDMKALYVEASKA